ncbi:hypothetical protein [Phocaeicola plebeius]|uniref:hypothetical protein n=1 Tax=Phocaeicola plebeius TaxID=310297 RepID=UPI0026F373B5|nr:hypothetical protein [Phocaeicola plebeius]
MKQYINSILLAEGELFGFPATFGIGRMQGELTVMGFLTTRGRQPSDLMNCEDVGVSSLTSHLTVIPASSSDFSVEFVRQPRYSALSLTFPGLNCGITLSGDSRQLLLFLSTDRLKSGNTFERAVAEVAGWLGISRLALIARQNGAGQDLHLLQQFFPDFKGIELSPACTAYQLLALGEFNLSLNRFGQCIRQLTGLQTVRFMVGGSLSDQSFGAQLSSGRIETEGFIFDGLNFQIQKSATDFFCAVSGTFIFKLDGRPLSFTMSGSVSNTSFVLSASSDARIPLNIRLSFSDLGLNIGVTPSGLTLGMIGRINTPRLSLFGGFAFGPYPPKITLLTAALTSDTGRISLRDLIVEVVDIQWDALECLDVIAVGDFDLTETRLAGGGVKPIPSDVSLADYDTARQNQVRDVVADFNRQTDSTLHITGEAQLTPLGNDTGQYILTDKGTMRHYRIDCNGKISLNCQLYICAEPLMLGNSQLPAGFFICGTLELFGKKIRFLFLADEGKSLVSLVQMDRIALGSFFILEKSQKPLPMEPINGGLAGQLVQSSGNGPVMYLNVQREKAELTFYLSAHISILSVFRLDTLVLIRDRMVFVNIEYIYWGFKTVLNLQGGVKDFASAGFKLSIVFDTSGFLEIIQKAQDHLKSAAQSVKSSIEDATRKLDEAQREVVSLQRQIDDFNRRIEECRQIIRRTKWYKLWIKAARAAEIAGLEIAKAGVKVAIGVAYGTLELAKKALQLGSDVIGGVLNSLTHVIGAVTRLLWIKSFELGAEVTAATRKIWGKLVLTVLGKEVRVEKELDLDNLLENIKSFISQSATSESDKGLKDIQQGKRAIESDEAKIDSSMWAACADMRQTREDYATLQQLRDRMDEFFLDANNAYFEAFNEEDPNARENACRLTSLRWEEEIFRQQHVDAFDDSFETSLSTLIQTLRQEKQASRADISDDMEQQMDILLDVVHSLRLENEARALRIPRASLFECLEQNIETCHRARRSRAAESEISAKDANTYYADTMSELIQKYLGDQQGEAAEEIRRTLALALYEFRNPSDTFHKQENNDTTDDEEDL